MYNPKSHGQMRATTSPTRAASAQLGFDGVPRPVIQYTKKNASTPMMIPVIRRIIRDSSVPEFAARMAGTLGLSLGAPDGPRQSGDEVNVRVPTGLPGNDSRDRRRLP